MSVDLEYLAAGYSHRPVSKSGLARARRAGHSVGLAAGDVALDVGGGRGRHAAVWIEAGALPIVVDPARGMVREAAAVAGVSVVCAEAQRLPMREECARLVYFHLSIHYGDWRRSLDEAMRVLGPGGECWIWTMGEQHHRESVLAKWFPSVGDIDAARFPDPNDLARYLEATGAVVETGREVESKTRSVGSWRDAVEARFVSTLQLISADEFAAGLARFDSAHPHRDEPLEYLLTFDWLRAIT